MKKTLLYFLLCCPLLAETLTGTCKRVVDGDTLHLDDGTKVQIWGIDAPEKGQPYAAKATASLDKTIKGRKLKITVRGTDQLGRTLADVSAGNTNLALFMVRTGMAWHDDYNAPEATDLAEAMKKARKAKKGLWADETYLFRKGGLQQPEPAGDEVICHYVQDGDTFKLPDNKTRVRLWGIDAPEKGQAYADEARARLKELCEGKTVRLEIKDTDQYGRKVAVVWMGKKNINLQMVKEGLAWHYAYFAPDAKDLAAAEKAARKARKGLWQDDTPVNPYDFRKASR
ncbi:MAG: thermonuclease family protein [Akkermansia sp.]|nr:thermonuclease family protein [Akkermansia sp.]